MNREQVREIVILTIEELTKRKLVNFENYQSILRAVEVNLYQYFDNKGDDTAVKKALHALSDDPYLEIIYFQYRDSKTLEWVAEYYAVDISTIKRNKKRLINKIYEYLVNEEL